MSPGPTPPPTVRTDLDEALAALKRDLVADGGPQISTMRSYRFAIVPYRPADEYALRQRLRTLTSELQAAGWNVLSISLHALLMRRIRALGDEVVQSLVERERRLHRKSPERALNHLKEKILPLVEGPDGIAADVVAQISDFADAHPDAAERSLVLVGRAGALYPFFRTSALLKHIDGKTRAIPVVLLYPGERRDINALSFMGELPADRDYRPRVYP
jgi:hypothetical protein